MQEAGKSAMASTKETAANIGASAKSGMEKTKAVVQEKVDKVTAHDLVDKDTAEQRKLEKLEKAEADKQAALARNEADRERACKGLVSTHPVSALPGHNPAGSANPGSHGTGGAYS